MPAHGAPKKDSETLNGGHKRRPTSLRWVTLLLVIWYFAILASLFVPKMLPISIRATHQIIVVLVVLASLLIIFSRKLS